MKIFEKIFKKKQSIKKMSWKDITVKQYYDIIKILKAPDDYTALNLIDIIYDIDSTKIPANELSTYISRIKFLEKDVDKVSPKKTYVLNGTKYDSNCNLTIMSTAQFIDYQNYIKNNRIEEILSCFFVPSGHSYNDGYDIEKVKKDLLSLKITDAYALAFFFELQLKMYCRLFRRYLVKNMKKAKMSKETIEATKKLDLYNLVSFPIFLNFVNAPTKSSQTH